MRCLIAVIIIVIMGCDSKEPVNLSYEQAILESLFVTVVGNAHQNIYIANATDSAWFLEYTIDDVLEVSGVKNAKYLTPDLLRNLYAINKKQEPLDWNPLMITATKLPARYASKPMHQYRKDLCLVNVYDSNIGVYSGEGMKGFRSYYSVSKVAIDEANQLAVLKIGYYCAPLSGAGEWLVVMSFENKRWVIKEAINFWIS